MEFNAVIFTVLVSLVISAISAPICIPLLRRLKFGQQIREDGPQSHLNKAGTPTMGGIIILLAFTITFFRFEDSRGMEFYILLLAVLGFGLIGFLDDYIKIVFKRSLGLTAKQKLIGQFLCAVLICFMLKQIGHSTDLFIPLLGLEIPLGFFYYPLIILLMMGMTNAVNFTDGLDGLLAGTSSILFGAYVVIAMLITQPETAIFSAAMIGALLGFLIFNAHPAKVFMGDTGSLGIGGAVAIVAILTKTEILLLLIGGVFIIEVLSVIIQVISFKTRGKRVFKMSPIHHHFELSGWSEWRVVITFWIAALLFAGLGLFIFGGL